RRRPCPRCALPRRPGLPAHPVGTARPVPPHAPRRGGGHVREVAPLGTTASPALVTAAPHEAQLGSTLASTGARSHRGAAAALLRLRRGAVRPDQPPARGGHARRAAARDR